MDQKNREKRQTKGKHNQGMAVEFVSVALEDLTAHKDSCVTRHMGA